MRVFAHRCEDTSGAAAVRHAARRVVLFGQCHHALRQEPTTTERSAIDGVSPLPNMWIEEVVAKYNNIDIRPLARNSGRRIMYEFVTGMYNFDQLDVAPVVPPQAAHCSWATKKTYGARMQQIFGFVASQRKFSSKWWVSSQRLTGEQLKARANEWPLPVCFPAEGTFFHISQLVRPHELQRWPLSGKTGRLFTRTAPDHRAYLFDQLQEAQATHKFSTGLFYNLKALDLLHLKLKPGEVGVPVSPTGGGGGGSAVVPGTPPPPPAAGALPDAQLVPFSIGGKCAPKTTTVHWYNSDDVMFPQAFAPPIVQDHFEGCRTPVNGATGAPIADLHMQLQVPLRASLVWFEAKYLLSVGAKVDVNSVPLIVQSPLLSPVVMVNADQLVTPGVAFHLSGTGYNVMSRLTQKALNATATSSAASSNKALPTTPSPGTVAAAAPRVSVVSGAAAASSKKGMGFVPAAKLLGTASVQPFLDSLDDDMLE